MDGRLEISERDFAQCDEIVKELPAYVRDWYLDMRSTGISAKSCKDYMHKVGGYLSYINANRPEIKLEELTASSARDYLIEKQVIIDNAGNKKASSKSYQQGLWSCLNSFFEYLENTEQIAKNPLKKNGRPKGTDLDRINQHRVLLTQEDFNKILKSVGQGCGSEKAQRYQNKSRNRDEAIMRLFMCTGLRESALTEINISDINFNTNTLFIYDKGNIPHTFILTPACMSAINKSLAERPSVSPSDPLFISARGNRMHENTVSALVKKFTEAALGKSLSPHKLRSGVCSILYHETKDIEFVRRFIGHSNTTITMRYIVTDGAEIEKGNEILTNLIG